MSDDRLAQAAQLIKEDKKSEAEKVYWDLLQSDPNHVIAGLNLASLLLERGKIDEAATLCKNVAERQPDLPPLNVLQSRICSLRGQFDAGLEHISKAFAAHPTDPLISDEFLGASRRRYWTVSPTEYQELFEAAAQGELDASNLPRLTHQLLARILHPVLLQMLCGGQDGTAPVDDRETPILDQFFDRIEDEDNKTAAAILRRNFEQAWRGFAQEPAFGPRNALIVMRDDSTIEADDWCDIDPLTRGSLELADPVSQTRYISPHHIKRIVFGPPNEATPCILETRDGQEVTGLMPVFSFFTAFVQDEQIRTGRKTVLRRFSSELELPLGLRAWWGGGKLHPMPNVKEIVFE
jgi:hypothetical protein